MPNTQFPKPNTQETIAAIATATGEAGIGVIRVSGPEAFAVADRLTRPRRPTAAQAGHTLRRVVAYDPTNDEVLDDGLLAVFHAPRSFTGEDVVEFQGHGGSLLLQRLLAAVLGCGARAARPGEFSERAFLSGKLDLAQAEAIADLIAAGTVAAQRAARRQLSGELSSAVETASEAIQTALAYLEATIDFPEEVGEVDAPAVTAALQRAMTLLTSLLSTATYGRRLRDGITVVLTGKPNVGKSSLLNALSGSERAIVTPIPGTTRDIVEESLNLGGIPVRALDTAGLRDTDDPVEQIGVERARRAVAEADVVVVVLDAGEVEGNIPYGGRAIQSEDSGKREERSEKREDPRPNTQYPKPNTQYLPPSPPTLSRGYPHSHASVRERVGEMEYPPARWGHAIPRRRRSPNTPQPMVIAVNKADVADATPLVEAFAGQWPVVPVSAVTGQGLSELALAIANVASQGEVSQDTVPLVTSARHETALRQALAALQQAQQTLEAGLPAELVAVDAHGAIHALGEITGATTREDIIASIFTRFCIGK